NPTTTSSCSCPTSGSCRRSRPWSAPTRPGSEVSRLAQPERSGTFYSMRFKAIQRVLGALIGMPSVIALPPFAIAIALDEATARAFVSSFLVSAMTGAVLWFPARRVDYQLRLRDGFFIVTATWCLVSLVCAIPFVIGPPHLSWVNAVFEATSGITTTGATVIVGLDALPKGGR